MDKDILFLSADDWANVGCEFAIAGREVGLDCLSVVSNHHIFGYPKKSYMYANMEELQGIANDYRVVVMMHSHWTRIERAVGQRWAVFHTGSVYRFNSQGYNAVLNEFIDVSLILTGELLDRGAVNEHWMLPPMDTDSIKPVYSESIAGIRIRHNPRTPFGKGSEYINKVMEGFKDRCDYKYDATLISWTDNIKRMSDCDVYVESLGIAGEWGVTALEVAALGKILITQFKSLEKYEQEYDCKCPILVANTSEELAQQVEKVLSMTPEEIRALQLETRAWVENIHGYVPTGLRLKEILCQK